MASSWCFCKDGRLYSVEFFNGRAESYRMDAEQLNISSITHYDESDDIFTVKYEDGRQERILSTVTDKVEISLYDTVYSFSNPDYSLYDMKIIGGIICVGEHMITGPVAQTVAHIEAVPSEYYIKIIFICGRIEFFKFLVKFGELLIVSRDGETYFTSSGGKGEERIYSIWGEMPAIKLNDTPVIPIIETQVLSYHTESGVCISAENGAIYYFPNFIGVPKRLYALKDSAVYANDSKLSVGMRVYNDFRADKSNPPEVVKEFNGCVIGIHPQIRAPNIIGTSTIINLPNTVLIRNIRPLEYYMADVAGNIVTHSVYNQMRRQNTMHPSTEWPVNKYSHQMFFENGHTSYILPHQTNIYIYDQTIIDNTGAQIVTFKYEREYFPIRPSCLLKILSIERHNGLFIINGEHVILSIPGVKNIVADNNHILTITTNTEELKCRLIYCYRWNLTYLVTLEENGENEYYEIHSYVKPVDGNYYSEYSKFTQVTEFEKIKSNVFKIENNYVMFKYVPPGEDDIYEIYAADGNYILICDTSVQIGLITIFRQSKTTKAALSVPVLV